MMTRMRKTLGSIHDFSSVARPMPIRPGEFGRLRNGVPAGFVQSALATFARIRRPSICVREQQTATRLPLSPSRAVSLVADV